MTAPRGSAASSGASAAAERCAAGAVERDQRGGRGAEQGLRLVEQARRGCRRSKRRAAARRPGGPRTRPSRRDGGGGHPGVIGMRRGGFTLRPTPGEVAEWLKALAC